ncbi:MAG TPA: hypothetical protein VGH37_21165 [Candidatus Acidoferrum sp.]
MSTIRPRIRIQTSRYTLPRLISSIPETLFGIAIIPFIDYSTGGSIDGQIRAAEANLAKVTDKMIVIPGHGAVGGKADLTLFRDVLVGIRDKVAALKKQGKSLEEIVAAKPGARTDEEWGQSFMSPSAFIALVHQGV